MNKKCEYCQNGITEKFGSGRFCSKTCSKKFSSNINKKIKNENIKKSLIGFKYNKNINGDTIKTPSKKHNKCISCEEYFERNSKNRNKKYCSDCIKLYGYRQLFKKLNISDNNLKIANDKSLKILKTEYFDNELSLLELREKYNIQLNSIHFYFKKNGINLRGIGDSLSLSYKNGKSNSKPYGPYKQGYHTTWDNKKVYLRSSYEFNYAKQLDDYKIKYDVEKIRIRYYDSIEQKYRTSIPDFYLSDLNMIVEIKSNYTINIQNMKDKIKSYKKLGYNTKVILEGKELII